MLRAKTDNEVLEEMYRKYKPVSCHCGEPDSVFHPGRCSEHAEEEFSDGIDKGVGGLGRHGPGGSNLDESDLVELQKK